jgi:GT2 family glycosyltransferase
MTFLEEFLKCLRWRPIQAIEALYWQLTRRRVRAGNCLRRNLDKAPYAYEAWIDIVERPDMEPAGTDAVMAGWTYRPRISILMADVTGADPAVIARSVQSVHEQSYEDWELLLPTDAKSSAGIKDRGRVRPLPAVTEGTSELAQAISQAMGEYLLVLRAGNRLPATALYHYIAALQAFPRSAVLFGDQDEIGEAGRRQKPWFKPQWNSEMFLAQDYLTDACLLELTLARSAAALDPSWPNSTPFSLMLAATTITSRPIVHIPHILCHIDGGTADTGIAERLTAVQRHVAPLGGAAQEGPFATVRVRWPFPAEPPLVSIIIPTRDKVELLESCISSLLALTDYRNYELLVIDNQSAEPATALYFERLAAIANVRILAYDQPYNYAAINNFAARHARGRYLCLLNNDTEVIDRAWLDEMVRQAVRPNVGAVGAMLLYADHTIQHAGVVIGMGEAAGHAHRNLDRTDPGYFCQAHIARFVSAVTAACLLVERSKFEAVGGLDEAGFGVAFNDVDFCLKLEKAGWRNIYAPQAVLLHHESKSRGNDMAPAHIERYMRELSLLQERWGTRTYVDPLHHVHLDRASETYSIKL